ncbi:MAG: hypothetical protein HYS35_09815 [Betaproteobacteria bacterium]|nr:hypothetical protein [Betaproteobacteria bacterium]
MTARAKQHDSADLPDLTLSERRELERRIKDMDDPVRYMVVSEFGPKFILYYNVSDDTFAHNNPSGGTLFKRKAAAESIRKSLRSATLAKFSVKGKRLKRLSPLLRDPLGRLAREYRKRRRAQAQSRGRRKSV